MYNTVHCKTIVVHDLMYVSCYYIYSIDHTTVVENGDVNQHRFYKQNITTRIRNKWQLRRQSMLIAFKKTSNATEFV